MATTLKDPLIDTQPEYLKSFEKKYAYDDPEYESEIDPKLTHPTSWSKLPKKERHWIIFAIVVGILVIGAGIGIALALTVFGPTRPAHKYLCTAHKNGYICMVDNVNGTCLSGDCCRFDCVDDKCRFTCTGQYTQPSDCIKACNQGVDTYGCVSGICLPTTQVSPVFKDDPCCGEVCPGCAITNSKLKLLSDGVVTSFGGYVGAGINGDDLGVVRVATSTTNPGTNSILLFDASLNSLGALTLTPVKDPVPAITTPCNILGPQIYVGQRKQSVGFLHGTIGTSCVQEYQGYVNGDFINTGNVVPLEPTSLVVGQTSNTDYLFYVEAGNMTVQKATSDAKLLQVGAGAVTNATSMCSGSLVNDTVLILLAGATDTNTVGFFTYTVANQVWTSTFNPFEGGKIPAGVTDFGKLVACSNDGTVVLVAGADHVMVYQLTHSTSTPYTSWLWSLVGMVSVPGVNNVAVSYDGKIVGWSIKDQDYLIVTTMFDKPLSHTQKLDIPSSTDPLGVGGLSINPVDGSTYMVLTTSAQQVYYWAIRIEG
jgi:hypothetical protein